SGWPVAAEAQASHAPSQTSAQHTPSTQKPLWHSADRLQASPAVFSDSSSALASAPLASLPPATNTRPSSSSAATCSARAPVIGAIASQVSLARSQSSAELTAVLP